MIQEPALRQRKPGEASAQNTASGWGRLRIFETALRPAWRSWAFFLVVGASAAFLGGIVVRTAYVTVLGESLEPEPLRKAVALDPADPELHHRLGMVLYDSPLESDRSEGLNHLRRATELNPYAARYWSDLAWVCELSGYTACAREGIERAVKLSPATPQLHWLAANALLRAGQNDTAMSEFRRLLELDPSYAQATYHVCLGSLGNPQLILDKVLPSGKNPALKLAYLEFLSTQEDEASEVLARQVWAQTVASGTSFPFPLIEPYVEHLLHYGDVDQADRVWRDLERLGVISSPESADASNLIYNGDFEQMPLEGGFDWRSRPAPYVALDFSDPASHTGKSCLRLDFTVKRNEEYRPLYHVVPVSPSQAYLMTAFVRSQDLTSDSGPILQVQDPEHSSGGNAATESTVGTTPWHQIRLNFCTGPDTKRVELSLVRLRARTYPTEITGSFWLDTVELKPVRASGDGACGAPNP